MGFWSVILGIYGGGTADDDVPETGFITASGVDMTLRITASGGVATVTISGATGSATPSLSGSGFSHNGN